MENRLGVNKDLPILKVGDQLKSKILEFSIKNNKWYYYIDGENNLDLINAKYFKSKNNTVKNNNLINLQPEIEKSVKSDVKKKVDPPKIDTFGGV